MFVYAFRRSCIDPLHVYVYTIHSFQTEDDRERKKKSRPKKYVFTLPSSLTDLRTDLIHLNKDVFLRLRLAL